MPSMVIRGLEGSRVEGFGFWGSGCMCIYDCLYIYMYIYLDLSIYIYVSISVSIYIYLRVYIHIWVLGFGCWDLCLTACKPSHFTDTVLQLQLPVLSGDRGGAGTSKVSGHES